MKAFISLNADNNGLRIIDVQKLGNARTGRNYRLRLVAEDVNAFSRCEHLVGETVTWATTGSKLRAFKVSAVNLVDEHFDDCGAPTGTFDIDVGPVGSKSSTAKSAARPTSSAASGK